MKTTDEMKQMRDGWLAFGERPRRVVGFAFKCWLPNGNYLTDDGGGGAIEWRPHGVPVIPGLNDRTRRRS